MVINRSASVVTQNSCRKMSLSVLKRHFLCCVIIVTFWQQSHCYPNTYQEIIRHFTEVVSSNVSREFVKKAIEEEISDFEGITRKDVTDAFSNYVQSLGQSAVPEPSQQCSKDIVIFLEGLISRDKWALEMLDSFGKPGSGLLQTNIQWFGSFDECVGANVSVVNESTTVVSHPFSSKYCIAVHYLVPGLISMFAPMMELGTCFPNSCSGIDLTIILNGVIQELRPNSSVTVDLVRCQEKLSLDGPAIAVLVVLGLFLILLITGTAYDVIFIQMPQWSTESLETPVSNNSIYTEQPVVSDNSVMTSGEYTPLLGNHIKNQAYLEKYTPGTPGKIILSFSVYTNGKKLLSTKQSSESLRAVHGIRFISMTWVILGHTYFFGAGMYANMFTELPLAMRRWTFDAIDNATVSVDTFFLLSGLLVAYLALKELKKGEGRLNWFMFYFHRYWRLTPPYMLVIMVYVPLFKYWATGPLYPQNGIDPNCKDNFWVNLLYLQNIVRDDRMCMGWAWYLANDMQFYILSPLIFVPFYYSLKFGIISASVFLTATVTAAGVVSSVYELPASVVEMFAGKTSGSQDYMPQYYEKPWCRMGPYIIGLVAGYILYRTRCKIRMNRVQCVVGWVSAAVICLAVLYGLDGVTHGHLLSTPEAALYNALHRTAWGVGVAWVVVACATGNGGYVNTILSWEALIPLSRLTYCAYLVHPVIMSFYYFSQHTLFFISDINMIYCFFGNMVASYLVAAVVSLTFESPMMGLEKALFNRDKKN